MPVLNDFGPEAYERVKAQAEALARRLNVQKEVIYGFFNETAHFPTSIAELEAWGNKMTKYGFARRNPATGAWQPVMPGVNPDPRLTPQDRGGFNHAINNPEDAEIQRFQQVDAGGNVFGGSWDPTVNAQHPEWAGKTGGDTALSVQAGGGTGGGGAPSVADYLKGNAPGGAGGLNDIINAALYGNQQEFDLKKNAQDFGQQTTRDARYDALRQAELNRYDQNRQFDLNRYDTNRTNDLNRYENRRTTEEGRLDSRFGQQLSNQQYQQGRFDTQRANDRSLYSTLAQALLGSAVELGGRPRDYFKYNQMLSGGKDIVQQLFGDQPRADFSGFTGGEPEAGRVTDILSALGLPQLPGGSVGSGSADAERDWLARQGVSALGNQDFFGAGADAREQAWMGSRVGPAPYVGPEPYTPPPDLPMMPSVTDYRDAARGAADRLVGGFDDFLKRNGVSGMGADDPRLLAYYQAETGLSAPAARFAAEKAADYYKTTGRVIPSSILAGWLNEAHSQDFNTDPARGQARAVARGYDDAARRLGYYPNSDDPATLQQYRDTARLDPASAIDASRRTHEYAGAVGRAPTVDELMRQIEEARTRGANTNQPYQQVRGLNLGYQNLLTQRGQPYLSANDPDLRGLYQSRGNLSPAGAQGATNAAADYYTRGGYAIPDPEQYMNLDRNRRRSGANQFAFA